LIHISTGDLLRAEIKAQTDLGMEAKKLMDRGELVPDEVVIGMINANMKKEVLESNTYWFCASCFHCTVRCPSEIDIAGLMYGLKRYSIWKHQYPDDAVGPVFSETFVKSILRSGRSYEPVLAPSYIFSYGVREFLNEAQTDTNLMLKGRLPVLPARIKRLENFKKMANRIIPMGGE
jgi:heterodisulfide reductase subunit C